MLDRLKNGLLACGPDSFAVRQAFRVQAASRGILMKTVGGRIFLDKGQRRIVLSAGNRISVPFLVRHWDLFFDTISAESQGSHMVLDFSAPGLHRYSKSGLSFYTPGIAEDDCMDAYTCAYLPQPGDVVWDVGAHAGMTSYFLAQMVGPTGTVYAFEPDETSHACLLRNIEAQQLKNVVPVKTALSDSTGTACFVMDGSMGAGLSDFLRYTAAENTRTVETLSFADGCDRFGGVPQYVKLDIEGAEISVISGAKSFLGEHAVHFSIESNHVVNGSFTAGPLESIFGQIGYKVWSSDQYGQLFTWAQPRAKGGLMA